MSEIDVSKCEHINGFGLCCKFGGKCEKHNCELKQFHQLKKENKKLEEKLEKIKRICINKEEARLLYDCKDFDFYEIVKIIESEN